MPGYPTLTNTDGDGLKRKMVIQRVRNPQDSTQFVDIAITVEIGVQTGSGNSFQRNRYSFATLQLGDENERSNVFEASSVDDVKAAADQFFAEHPD